MEYIKIIPKDYAKYVRKKFLDNPTLWFDVISPKEKAKELMHRTNGDYSLIWHEHCELCWERIDASTESCYKSEDNLSWLCNDCFNKITKT